MLKLAGGLFVLPAPVENRLTKTAPLERMTEVAAIFVFASKMFRLATVILFGLALLGSLVALAQRPPAAPQPNQEISPIAPPQPESALRSQRIREGTAFKNMLVFFRPAGDRTVLYTVDENRRFTCLENLQLERILTVIRDKPERQFWKISGEFTEFRGENYVFIRHATNAPAPSANGNQGGNSAVN